VIQESKQEQQQSMPEAQPSLPPAVQQVVEQAQTTVDGQPATVVKEAPPGPVVPISQAKKPNKMDLKRQEIFVRRLQRKMNEEVTGPDGKKRKKTQEEALAEISREDYESLPPGEKIRRLEGMVAGMGKQVARDIMNLRRNDGAIADSFDINYRGIAMMFEELGISRDRQREIMAKAHEEFQAERQKAVEEEARKSMEALHKAKEADEQAKMEKEAAKAAAPVVAADPAPAGEPDPHIADGATVFNG
jgi:hypothetical protein